MEELIFIYNARSGLFNKMSDFAHKILSPDTYECSLCGITYGDFTMKTEWKAFLRNLPFEKVFLYKDQLDDHPELKELKLPAILKRDRRDFEVLISAGELNHMKDLGELMARLSEKLGFQA